MEFQSHVCAAEGHVRQQHLGTQLSSRKSGIKSMCKTFPFSMNIFLFEKKNIFFVKMLFMLTYNYLKYLETFSVSI